MGVIISSILSLIRSSKPYKILMVGLDGAGKTTLLYKIKLGEVIQTIPTIGFNIETVEYKNISFTVCDTNSQPKLRPLLRHYYPGTSAFIYIIDSTDTERFDEIKEELHYMMDNDELEGCPLLVMANKQDLPKAASPSFITEALELQRLKRRSWFVQGTSAINSSGINESLDWLANEVTK
ncbi:ADP-ribosylation factor 4-like [Palaemon carinicauda]|uniref:ADP-ribosylation factor 4-like n=1 Tax=Palaemon carinicauda TaxID=392227 RepID=UPI0035B653D7